VLFRNQLALSLGLLATCGSAFGADLFNLASAGQLTSWSESQPKRLSDLPQAAGLSNLGFEWEEERDIREIRVRFSGDPVRKASVEYWFRNWPYEPPKMPTFEDPLDDPWQGEWLKGAVSESCKNAECTYRFERLADAENRKANNLPGVRYRRTLKVRLVYPQGVPSIESLRVYSGSEEFTSKMRVELATGDSPGAQWMVSASVYNGRLGSAEPWQFSAEDTAQGAHSWSFHPGPSGKGLLLDVIAAKPDLSGSHDVTVVTIHAKRKDSTGEKDRSFSFAVDDLRNGSIVVPDLQALVVDLSSSANRDSQKQDKLRVRQRIPREPEQTFERASREIPPLDPWETERGDRVYLPLAPDSNWQKFAFEYGGNVFVSKKGIKAKGRELERLQWEGDRITWRIGTGATPYYRDDHQVTVRKLDGYLPVVTQTWEREGIRYSEEAYATLLGGELSPENSARNEETPAILMVKLSAKNESGAPAAGHVWLSVDAAGTPALDGRSVKGNGKLVAYLGDTTGDEVSLATIPNGGAAAKGIHVSFELAAAGEHSVVIKLSCVSDIGDSEIAALDHLDYAAERARIVAYWKQIVSNASRFTVPEPKFNLLAKSVVAQVHISTTRS